MTRVRIEKRPIRAPEALNEAYEYEAAVPFSRGTRVSLGPSTLLLISGTASVDEAGLSVHFGDLEAQTWRMFRNITALLAAEGADWHDVIRTTIYLADMRHYEELRRVRNAFFAEVGLDVFPASTCIEARLCRPELLVETEAMAMIPSDRPRP